MYVLKKADVFPGITHWLIYQTTTDQVMAICFQRDKALRLLAFFNRYCQDREREVVAECA
jgi:hypothetical protein